MIRGLVLAGAVSCILAGCAPSPPHRHAPHHNTAQLDRLVAGRNANVMAGLRSEREARNRAFFHSRIEQAHALADAGAYEAALLVLDDAQHFAAATLGSANAVAGTEAHPRSFIKMHLGMLSYDHKQYSLAKAQWRDALARVATQRALRKPSIDAKRTLDILRSGGDFTNGPTPAQDEAMQQLILAPDPKAPKPKRSIFNFLFKHAPEQQPAPPRMQHVLDVQPGPPKPSPAPTSKPVKKRRHKFLGIF